MANLTDADKVLRNDTGKDIVTQLTAIKTAIENGGGGSGASTVSQLTDVLLSQNIPDGDVLVRDNNLTGGKLWKNATITVELTQAEYNQLVADDDVLPDVNYYITDAPSMQGTSADLSYDGTTTSTYAKISDNADRIEACETAISGIGTIQSIITATTLTSTATDYNTYNNRKFTDYDLIVFRFGASQFDTRQTVLIPSSVWLSGQEINMGALHGSNVATPSSYSYSSMNLKYKSDTSITAIASGSAVLNTLFVYGIKLK